MVLNHHDSQQIAGCNNLEDNTENVGRRSYTRASRFSQCRQHRCTSVSCRTRDIPNQNYDRFEVINLLYIVLGQCFDKSAFRTALRRHKRIRPSSLHIVDSKISVCTFKPIITLRHSDLRSLLQVTRVALLGATWSARVGDGFCESRL